MSKSPQKHEESNNTSKAYISGLSGIGAGAGAFALSDKYNKDWKIKRADKLHSKAIDGVADGFNDAKMPVKGVHTSYNADKTTKKYTVGNKMGYAKDAELAILPDDMKLDGEKIKDRIAKAKKVKAGKDIIGVLAKNKGKLASGVTLGAAGLTYLGLRNKKDKQ
jgi:hypothetical protein